MMNGILWKLYQIYKISIYIYIFDQPEDLFKHSIYQWKIY